MFLVSSFSNIASYRELAYISSSLRTSFVPKVSLSGEPIELPPLCERAPLESPEKCPLLLPLSVKYRSPFETEWPGSEARAGRPLMKPTLFSDKNGRNSYVFFLKENYQNVMALSQRGAERTGSAFGVDLTPEVIPGRTLPVESGRSGSLVLKFGGVSLGKSGISSGRTGARVRVFGELGRDDGADEGAELRPLLAKGLPLDVMLLLPEIRPADGVDESMAGRRVGVDDRELERLTEGTVLDEELVRVIAGTLPEDELGRLTALVLLEDELDKVRDREIGVDDLELCADVFLGTTELDTEGRFFTGVDGRIFVGVDRRPLTGVEDRVGTGRDDGTDGFDAVRVAVRLLGVVGLELTEEMFALRTDDLLLLDIGVD
ncbi:unnamed protein product [Miscanthus lutarioriparius]|uniref:Uncharacterized protein n=1 Tax=Miscanthus lutarioriparius TaxID=422564 RepID=A0A811NYX2_9POAL|nr:unnamed protein product [Miscanthus lutarioriparius]